MSGVGLTAHLAATSIAAVSCDATRACLLQVSVAAAERLLVARTGFSPLKASVESVPVSQSADALQPLYEATGLQVVAYDPTRVAIAAVPWYLAWLKKTKKAPSASSLCAALVAQNAGVQPSERQQWQRLALYRCVCAPFIAQDELQ